MDEQLRDINSLHPHPLQAAYYSPCSEVEDRALLESLRKEGQKDPVVILPDGTILDGNRRIVLLKQLGIDKVWVKVREDLANADPGTIEQAFLQYNFNRRQLHPLDMARIGLRLYEIERGRPYDKLSGGRQKEARDRVGVLLGISGRNLQRYMNVLKTPPAIQRAVKSGYLTLKLGELLSRVSVTVQENLASQLEEVKDGKTARSVVSFYLPTRVASADRAASAVTTLVRSLRSSLSELVPLLQRIDADVVHPHRSTLCQGQELIRTLLKLQSPDTLSGEE